MDKNTIIGFGLLALLFFGYFFYTQQGQVAMEKQKQHIQDSLARLQPKIDSSIQNTIQDSLRSKEINNSPASLADTVKEQLTVVENNLVKITFTNKGAQPKIVELKKFKAFDGKALLLTDGTFSNFSYAINTGNNHTAQSNTLIFNLPQVIPTENNGKRILFEMQLPGGEKISHEYTLRPDDYMIDLNISLNGSSRLMTQNTLNLVWTAKAKKQERDIEWETQQSHVSYVESGEYDFEHLATGKDDDKKFTKPLDWIALNQQFFVNSIVAKNKFSSGEVKWVSPKDTALNIIGEATASLHLNLPQGDNVVVPLQLYYGPSDYKILKSYGNEMYNMVPLGSGIFAFVKYVNRGFIMPVFNFLSARMVSYGLIIALMTIIIRLLISPLTYQSYLSGAKMKLLKPEIEVLKEKFKDDKQAFGMEQMKLFKSAGVNPLGGCIPALLQIPIFFALYNFFNSNITLRGQSFWWAKDLSTYDSIYNLPFSIPFYGDHVSLFTIFAVITSLLISIYGMSNMQDNSNPVMKYLPYIFPIILLGVFNRLPSALTWYYTVSNVITLLIQFVIQKYIIDHEKILAKLQENKKKPASKSKWQERITAMQESNEKLKAMKQKTTPARKK
ncbi:MAG: membrane protein insertase YidC [Ginsengibacter sp.]